MVAPATLPFAPIITLSTISFSTIGGILLNAPAIAQNITPASDELSTQVQQQDNLFTITGGQTSRDGASLFHSFGDFSLDPGQTARFITPATTESVLGRIVGGNPSSIDGTVQLLGSQADLYLLNPAGIVLGQNAALDVPGAFLGATATGIGYEDGFGNVQWFNVLNPAVPQNFAGSPSLLRFEVVAPAAIANVAYLKVPGEDQIRQVGGNQQARFAPIMPLFPLRVSTGRSLRFRSFTASGAIPPQDLPGLLTGAEGVTPASLVTITDQGQVVLQGDMLPRVSSDIPLNIAAAGDTVNISGDDGGSFSFATAIATERITLGDTIVNVQGEPGHAAFNSPFDPDSGVTNFPIPAATLAQTLSFSAFDTELAATMEAEGIFDRQGSAFGRDLEGTDALGLGISLVGLSNLQSLTSFRNSVLSSTVNVNSIYARQDLSDHLDTLTASEMVGRLEQLRATEYGNHWGITYQVPVVESSVGSIQTVLQAIAQNPGTIGAVMYAFINGDDLELTLVLPSGPPQRHTVEGVASSLLAANLQLRQAITSPFQKTKVHRPPAQSLYKWLLAPFRKTLEENGVELLMFSLDSGLRSLPVAALHDGEQYLIENYAVAVIPSFGLLETEYKPLAGSRVLVAGASEFDELGDLPAVPVEIAAIQENWPTVDLTEDEFTLDAMQNIRSEENFAIAHLATHAVFRDGDPSNSFVQLWGQERLGLDAIASLNFRRPPLELLVLSACQTAFGNTAAELGFAGLSVQSGAKSVVASLWRVSDTGTLALMSEFYDRLGDIPTKAEALRQSQLALLRNEATAVKTFLAGTSRGDFDVPELTDADAVTDFTHPYFWSGFTLVGSPW
ncbi:MAG: CHAT domain-containing protein [Cyanobacteria bacterium P01_F01_bin.153]